MPQVFTDGERQSIAMVLGLLRDEQAKVADSPTGMFWRDLGAIVRDYGACDAAGVALALPTR